MRGIIIVALVVSCIGCAKPKRDNPTWDAEFDGYVHSFQDYVRLGGTDVDKLMYNLSIHFGTTNDLEGLKGGVVVGVCRTLAQSFDNEEGVDSDEREVIIDETYWNRFGTYTREALIYHELGHCVLHKAHDNETFSLMNPYLPSETYYINHHVEYLSRFFNLQSNYIHTSSNNKLIMIDNKIVEQEGDITYDGI